MPESGMPPMVRVTVRLPRLLAGLIGDVTAVTVEAATVEGALGELTRRHPALAVHLFDESGELRRHVLCYHNEENTRWRQTLATPLQPGDEITILQAVSGGRQGDRA